MGQNSNNSNFHSSSFYSVAHAKALAKRSQHVDATYRNIVGLNMLCTFGHRVAKCWMLLAQVWKWSIWAKQHPTIRNMSRKGGPTHATCFPNIVTICYVAMLRSFGRGLTDTAGDKLLTLLYMELAISFLIGRKRTVNFRKQRPWRQNCRLYNNHAKHTQDHG